MNWLNKTIRVALLMSSLMAARQALAAGGEREVAVEINKANGLLRSGDIDAALKAYGQVQNEAPDRADLSYNMAVAQYRKGDLAAAEKLFDQAAASENDSLAAKANYNLGNCNYAAALRSAESDRAAAIKGLEKAIENYRNALKIDSNDADSRANIELAAAMIDKLREQDKKKQQQKKDQQDQKKENSKQQETQDKKDSQQNKDQQQSQPNQQQKPDSPQEKKSQGEQQGSQEQQEKNGDKPESKSQQSTSEPQDSKSQPQQQTKPTSADQKKPSKPQADQSQQRQSQAPSEQTTKDKQSEKGESKQSEDVKEQQGKAAPKGALSAADQKDGKTNAKGKELADQPEVVPEGAMTTQEAEKMLQAIRDQEMIRRMKRQAAERNQHVPVDRDW